MNQEMFFTASLVGRLKGAPLSVVILLMLSGKPQPAEYLRRYSRYSDKTVQDALLFLQDEGLLSRNGRYSWQLTMKALQLPLMAQIGLAPIAGVENEELDPSLMTLTGTPLSSAAGEEDLEGEASGTPQKGDRDTEFPTRRISVSLARVFNLDSSLIKDSRKENLASDTEKFRVLFEALARYGVREPARTRLARMAGMTLERIEYHCEMCPTGQAIYRIEHNWAIPKNAMDSVQQRSEPADDAPETINPQGEQEPPDIPEEILDAWDKTLDQLRSSLGQATYSTWVAALQIGSYCEECLTLLAANHYVIDSLQAVGMGENEFGQVFSENYGSQYRSASKLVGYGNELEIK